MAVEAYYSSEHYNQQRRLLVNGDPRALVCFCVDVSRSMNEWWIQEGGLSRHTGSGYSDGHNVQYFDLDDILPGYAHYNKMDKLNETLLSLLSDLKADPELRGQVAVSIITYSRYADVKFDFLDCEAVDISQCKCYAQEDATSMSDALRVSMSHLDEMQEELRSVDNDFYTPILIFMTDGTPTDDPREEFRKIRDRVSTRNLYLFPLGIGESANMTMLRDMFPTGQVPLRFSERYKMVRPEDYDNIFQDIKARIRMRQRVMVSEGNTSQSKAAIEDSQVQNNQMGQSIFDLISGI